MVALVTGQHLERDLVVDDRFILAAAGCSSAGRTDKRKNLPRSPALSQPLSQNRRPSMTTLLV